MCLLVSKTKARPYSAELLRSLVLTWKTFPLFCFPYYYPILPGPTILTPSKRRVAPSFPRGRPTGPPAEHGLLGRRPRRSVGLPRPSLRPQATEQPGAHQFQCVPSGASRGRRRTIINAEKARRLFLTLPGVKGGAARTPRRELLSGESTRATAPCRTAHQVGAGEPGLGVRLDAAYPSNAHRAENAPRDWPALLLDTRT